VLSTVDMVVQRRDGPRRLRDHDDDDDDDSRHHHVHCRQHASRALLSDWRNRFVAGRATCSVGDQVGDDDDVDDDRLH